MKILFVDDEQDIRESVRRILERDGHTVVLLDDGLAALHLLRAQDEAFDLVITDVRMPHMPGLELLDRLEAANIVVPVVLVTGHGNMDTALHALRRQAFDFLPKPFTKDQLRQVIDRVRATQIDGSELLDFYPYSTSSINLTFAATEDNERASIKMAHGFMRGAFKKHRKSLRSAVSALTEAVRNARIHGSKNHDALITLSIVYNPDAITMTVTDSGEGFDWKSKQHAAFDFSGLSKKGILRMVSMTDATTWNAPGNQVSLTVRFPNQNDDVGFDFSASLTA